DAVWRQLFDQMPVLVVFVVRLLRVVVYVVGLYDTAYFAPAIDVPPWLIPVVSVKELCSYLGISRSGYYAYLKRKTNDPDRDLTLKILAIYEQRKKTVGYRR
ncbi:hypothetical protein ACWKW1_28255, partial [Brevibacillus parabrevis]